MTNEYLKKSDVLEAIASRYANAAGNEKDEVRAAMGELREDVERMMCVLPQSSFRVEAIIDPTFGPISAIAPRHQ